MDIDTLKEIIREKDNVIYDLRERLYFCKSQLSYLDGATLKIQKVLKRHDDGTCEVLMITNIQNTPDGIIVEVL